VSDSFEGKAWLLRVDPIIATNLRNSDAPSRDPSGCDTQDAASSLRPTLELPVAEQTANKLSELKRKDVKIGQTKAVAAKLFLEKIPISGDKGWVSLLSQ
jgi:hypothetical protein